jgi:hypothetical protein
MRIRFTMAVAAVLAVAACGLAQAQSAPWRKVPRLVVVSDGADPRLEWVDDAIVFWNQTLEALRSGFRLDPAQRLALPVPEVALQQVSQSITEQPGRRVPVPEALRDLPGDLIIVLGETAFASFYTPNGPENRHVVAISGMAWSPMNLPNVARNVIVHELGHAIGLGHNSDPTTLMCGGPAPCRPALFQSAEPRLFPLADDDRRQLLVMYPPQWQPSNPAGR